MISAFLIKKFFLTTGCSWFSRRPYLNTEPTLQIKGATATITLCRPDLANRLGNSDLATLRQYIDTINAAREVTVMRLLSTGKYFCGGYDLLALGEAAGGSADAFGDLADALETARPISIAAIQGGVYGGATDLCLACDFRVGSSDSKLEMPALKLGVHLYQSGLERYVSRLGLNAAKRLLLTAEKIDSKTMLEVGFLTEIVNPEQLQDRIDELGLTLQTMAPQALLSVKKHLNRIARSNLDSESLAFDIQQTRNSDDGREGLVAWRERRSPVYKGS